MALDIWAELGIGSTADAAAIRRAYALRLKASRPDTDPQGFARLRGAYERALALASAGNAPVETAARPSDATQPATAIAPPPEPMLDHLSKGNALAAADWLATARAAGTLSLAADVRLGDQLGWSLAQDTSLPGAAVLAAASLLGWSQPGLTGPWAAALQARLDAEQWLTMLRRDAASRTRWLGGARAIAARMMLGTGPVRTLPVMGADPTLRRRYGEYLFHRPVVGHAFNADRIGSVGRLLTGRTRRRKTGEHNKSGRWIAVAITLLLVLAIGAIGNTGDASHAWAGDLATVLLTAGIVGLAVRAVWRWTRWLWARVRRW